MKEANLSQVKNSGLFLCPELAPLCQRSDPRQPNERSAGAKEGGVILFILFILIHSICWAGTFTDTQLCNAIFLAEGGYKAQYLYGIRSVHYKDETEARKICLNTIRNNRKRFLNQTKYKDYLEFLANRYCPVSAHPLNKNWLKNVKYFLEK